MRILLTYPTPDVCKDYRFGYSLLLLYVASALREHGHDIGLLDYSCERFTEESFRIAMSDVDILLMEIDAFPLKRSTNIRSAEKIAAVAKECAPMVPILAIGKQCTLLGKPISFADTTISGDSETFVCEIVERLDRKSYKSYYNAGTISELDKLPVPAYDLLSSNQIGGQTVSRDMHLQPSGLMETARGCPGVCTFCQRKGWSHGVQYFSMERVLSVFRTLVASGIRNIWIVDENFGADLSRAKELLRRLSETNDRSKVRLSISSWVQIDKEFLELAYDAGVSIISFGIESVTRRNQDFYRKRIDTEKTREILAYADKIGLYTVGNFIIGSPYDTEQTIAENLSYAMDSGLDIVNIKILDYMIGAELHQKLPSHLRGQIDVHACRELGLCKFSRVELKQISINFQNRFRISRIKKKWSAK